MATIEGQNLRLFIGTEVIAASRSCQFHVAVNLEDCSSKDTPGVWAEQIPTGITWDLSAEALVLSLTEEEKASETAYLLEDMERLIAEKTLLNVSFNLTNGTNNREIVDTQKAWYGKAILTEVSVNAPNKQLSTYSIKLEGVGELEYKFPVSADDAGGGDIAPSV